MCNFIKFGTRNAPHPSLSQSVPLSPVPVREVAAEQARMLAARERKVAGQAKAAADIAREDAAASYESVRSVIEQLRGIQVQPTEKSEAAVLPPLKVASGAAGVLSWLYSGFILTTPLTF